MINYTSQNQLTLDLFEHPFETKLDKNNRWVKLAEIIPWDKLASVYSRKLESNIGRKSVNIRMVIAAIIVKHKLNLSDRETVEMIQENLYVQYFCGLKSFSTARAFDPSLFVDIRKRMGDAEFDAFNCIVIEKAESIKPHQSRIIKSTQSKSDDESSDSDHDNEPKNKGTLKVDATVCDQEIKYPTDLGLLDEARQNLERMINLLHNNELDGTKPRTYCRVARQSFLNISKKKKKSVKEIRRGIKSQLQFIRRDLGYIDEYLLKPYKSNLLEKRDHQILSTIRQLYEQQKWMYDNNTHTCPDRIVSIYQPWVRPIVRGKDKNKVEFGSKINLTEVAGFSRINKLSWDAFNEGCDLQSSVENFRKLFGRYPKLLLADKIYLTRENRKYLTEKGIEIIGKPLGRPPKQAKESPQQRHRKKKKAAQRNHVEGKFGQGKRGYHLNNIKARLSKTSESMVGAIVFIMNLVKLLQIAEKYYYFSVLILKILKYWLKNLKIQFSELRFQSNLKIQKIALV